MASSLRLSAGSLVHRTYTAVVLSQSLAPNAQQYRAFSQAPQRWAYRSQNFRPPSISQPAMKTRAKDLLQGQMPNDIGLLPGTFVRPAWKDMPSIFQNPGDRFQMEWTSLKSRFQNFMSLCLYFWPERWFPLRPQDLRERRSRARLLYKDMYTALASGDIPGVRRLCCDGLARKLVNQIESRPRNEQVTWNLVNWIRAPNTYFTGVRVVSDRATKIPEVPNSGIRQIILRVTSRQSMSKSKTLTSRGKSASQEVAKTTPKVQDCDEFLVIQQLIWNDKDSGWRVWGYAKPTTLEKVQTDPFFAPGLSTMDRLEAMKEMMGGRS
ncbi:uncharacterized protein N7459_000669 [Penicillium hispanicum]|uniref:uncharacterized protein n=1 Tax=Penicillium hispanicum TaxID=1080232 RepID=UPI002540BA03|nr:uncharacterized protein N7459_000669 [Penicillium hispanicum]KAJ5594461.1 hypothetical protein N7459_000669 [Penicillium hispanicum]